MNTSQNLTGTEDQSNLWNLKAIISSGSILALLTIIGNSISLVVFMKTKVLRRRRPYYLLVNLCIADLLVGINVFLRVIFDLGFIYRWTIDNTIKRFCYTLDYFSSLASVFLLSEISVERFVAVVFPFYHRTLGNAFYITIIAAPWALSSLVISIYVPSKYTSTLPYIIFKYLYLVFLYLPVLIIIIAYSGVLLKVKFSHVQGGNSHKSRQLRDKKLAVTLLIVTLTSLITWMPYNCFLTMWSYLEYPYYDNDVFFALLQLQYSNSCVNILVYAWRMPEFRHVLFGSCRRGQVAPLSHEDTRPIPSRPELSGVSRSGAAVSQLEVGDDVSTIAGISSTHCVNVIEMENRR
ncbi:delta-type opioid receptor-like [Nematostella vectensis]|uniref:delta-type opioid receptor-like n=1 Tax=Nematostella vectensis TaxID=45351 RepID=UPI0020774846|nr:delta-type opioid receptor-like [Nematostella vectensis]